MGKIDDISKISCESSISIAPMMDYSNRHFRYLMRLMSKHAILYTEMITAQAILHSDADRLLAYDQQTEHPIILQLGGSEPEQLAKCAKLAHSHYQYNAINLNVGCPSDRVQSGKIGACLMSEPELVADCVLAMREAVADQIPITVKTRLGIDHQDSYEFAAEFINTVSNRGKCKNFIIHARKAWLQGLKLSPKQNRDIPPLMYYRVYKLKQDFPQLHIGINGGIKTLEDIQQHLQQVDEVMLGRIAYQDAYKIAEISAHLRNTNPTSRQQITQKYLEYCLQWLEQTASNPNQTPISVLIKPIISMFHGQANARLWRREIGEIAANKNAASTQIKMILNTLNTMK